ncbi:uncharacterized protein LOC135925290 [Gordionus sp. m RMFG-2023]|uniref:uncharacterized protein LOC135925290 n=1 Tax=Gordionus sp. m RMFG-2023 TaxID=3053472 RepID=UPI0031FE0921
MRDIDECKQGICQNGAFCEDLLPPRMFKCTCKPYTYGKICDKEYPKSEEGFQCQSTDKSSLISWVPEENFRILDYFPFGLRNVKTMSPKSFRKFVSLKLKLERGMDIGSMAKSWLKTHATHVYIDHEKDPTIVESLRPPHYIRYYNDWGFNFNWAQTHTESDVPFQHVIEMVFPAPVLIRGFVTRGGYEKRNVAKDCAPCKRLVTKYKVSVRRGSSKWFRLRNPDSSETVFEALSPGEISLNSAEDLKKLDVDKPRYRAVNPAVTAEALRIHVVDWWPRELDLSSLLTTVPSPHVTVNSDGRVSPEEPPPPHLIDVKNLGRERMIRSQNPVMRIDVMGCHGMIV